MTRVLRSQDCGNSPKNIFIQNFAIALSKGDAKHVLAVVSDDVCWIIVGNAPIKGKANLREALMRERDPAPTTVVVDHVVSHGKAGAVNGTLEFNGGTRTGFCHVFEFINAKGGGVKVIKSYFVDES